MAFRALWNLLIYTALVTLLSMTVLISGAVIFNLIGHAINGQ